MIKESNSCSCTKKKEQKKTKTVIRRLTSSMILHFSSLTSFFLSLSSTCSTLVHIIWLRVLLIFLSSVTNTPCCCCFKVPVVRQVRRRRQIRLAGAVIYPNGSPCVNERSCEMDVWNLFWRESVNDSSHLISHSRVGAWLKREHNCLIKIYLSFRGWARVWFFPSLLLNAHSIWNLCTRIHVSTTFTFCIEVFILIYWKNASFICK